WERMRDAGFQPADAGPAMRPQRPAEPPDVTRDTKAFTAAIRTRAFAFLRAWSIRDDAAALAALDASVDGPGDAWTVERLRALREEHVVEHKALRLDPEARNLRHTSVQPSPDGTSWRVQQMLIDAEGLNDWVLELHVDLASSRAAEAPVVQLLRLGSLA
ncbi:MAG TPA: DUF3516 domain-containing protein, partial [Vicinamibacteria bacterium]|nr:DUF3516 domain-containing protein [Vicinamibacteria bacterium]